MSERSLMVSFDGDSWHAADAEGNSMPLQVTPEQWLPMLPDGCFCEQLLLPVESLLLRTFTLPLNNPRMVDEEILGQELDDRAGIEPDEWWLAWQADRAPRIDTDGQTGMQVAGLVFGLPTAWKAMLETTAAWQQVRFVGVDGWTRLYPHLTGLPASDMQGCVALFDADRQGLFFAVWRGGVCRGLRRVNRLQRDRAALAVDVRRSLSAMTGDDEPDYIATGLIDEGLLQALALPVWQGRSSAVGELPDRHAANLDSFSTSVATGGPNFRHGHWAAASGFAWLKPWQRSISLAAMLLLVWIMGLAYQNHGLNQQMLASQQQIISAFHQGLPAEQVMIDPLAQLRRAAGGGAGTAQSSAHWLQQLAAIDGVYSDTPWDMRELEWRNGHMKMSGKAGSLQMLNSLRQALQQKTGAEVTLLDTDLSGEQVNFRMQW
ncbi:MAG: GspL/Epsl periplasmic domain-containing protein [Mariprofundus sp.]